MPSVIPVYIDAFTRFIAIILLKNELVKRKGLLAGAAVTVVRLLSKRFININENKGFLSHFKKNIAFVIVYCARILIALNAVNTRFGNSGNKINSPPTGMNM